MTRWGMTILLLGSGCVAWDFEGEQGQLGFTSNIRRPHHNWTPNDPVAVGSRIEIRATAHRQPDGGLGAGNPDASPLVDDAGVLASVESLDDLLRARVAGEGSTTVQWQGVFEDRFTLRAENAASVRLSDPVLQLREATLDGGFIQGGPWPDVVDPVRIVAGAPLRLDVVVLGDDGGRLGAPMSLVELRADAGLTGGVENYARLQTDAPSGTDSLLQFMVLDAGMGSWAVRSATVAEVARIELAAVVITPGTTFGFKATALDSSGNVIWQPPFTWQFSEGFLDQFHVDGGIRTPYTDERTDVLLLDWKKTGAAGDHAETVAVTLGSLRDEVTVTVSTPPLPGAPPSCGCEAGGDGPTLSALLLLLLWGQRRRVEKKPPADTTG
ncbi:MAG: MYXO-CTERM sorting domain-containing protein [Myxococcota bacterium]